LVAQRLSVESRKLKNAAPCRDAAAMNQSLNLQFAGGFEIGEDSQIVNRIS
jgi:hypothetical protein